MSFSERNEIIFGASGIEKLKNSSVAVYGLGGVGAAAAMALVRSGVGTIKAVDFDTVSESNLNRLIFGFDSTVGMKKSDVFLNAAKSVNPDVNIEVYSDFMRGADAASMVLDAGFHIDAIDSLNPKVNLIIALLERNENFISSMGTGGRICPEKLEFADIWKTDVCSLAKFVRKRLRNRGVKKHFSVVFSREIPCDPIENEEENDENPGRIRKVQGSTVFVPQAAGLMLASYAVRTLLKTD
ncbi:ThiF family adenylyltransferase [bacterium]|nr:ThiF family adenylyltransferase [bacterium]